MAETGWTDKYPHKADAGDEYYFVRRKDRNDVVVMGFSMGRAWLNGVSYEPSELRSHLFLGPLSPSDAEQLHELRRALLGVRNGMGCWCKTPFVNASEDRPHEPRCLAVFTVLNPKPEKETQS